MPTESTLDWSAARAAAAPRKDAPEGAPTAFLSQHVLARPSPLTLTALAARPSKRKADVRGQPTTPWMKYQTKIALITSISG
jgi:hypothetical protein